MKTQFILVAVAALAVSTGFAADAPKGEKKGGGTPEQRAELMMKNLDKDADSKLSKEELAAAPVRKPKADAPVSDKPQPTPEERAAKMIERGDADKDGKLDKAELIVALTQAPKKPK